MKNKLNPVWLKATVIGSLWASSEIILGSFLHNLQVPFSGTILSSIGIILLVGSSRYWQAKGIIWRAGLICAVMKTISPSAAIFGPMISIAAEAFILEGTIGILGSNYLGFLTGGGLAVSWSLFYKIINLIIIYGFNIVGLYAKLYQFAMKQLNIPLSNPWILILLLFVIDLIIGAAASVIGIRVGEISRKNFGRKSFSSKKLKPAFDLICNTVDRKYSLLWLIFHIAAIIIGLISLSKFPLWVSSSIILAYVGICLIQYQQNLKRLEKPKFWLVLIIITLLSGLFLSGFKNNSSGLTWAGLTVGVAINLRASLMVFGFSSLSIELRNPAIENWFKKKGMDQFSQSLEVAFKILPFMVANVSEEKMIFKKPVASAANLINKADDWLERIEKHSYGLPLVFILKGEKGSGKTSLLSQTVDLLKAEGIMVGGILAPGSWKDDKRSAFDILDVQTRLLKKLCSIESRLSNVRTGHFNFNSEGLELGREALSIERIKDQDVCVIDEVGYLELKGEGWSANLDELFSKFKNILVLVVRNELLNEVCEKWSIQYPVLTECKKTLPEEFAYEIIHYKALISEKVPVEI